MELAGHRPQAVTRDLIESHDLVVVMEWRHLAQLRHAYPEHRNRMFLLPLFDDRPRSAYERYNIADPFGKPFAAFEDCYQRMDRAVRRLVAELRG